MSRFEKRRKKAVIRTPFPTPVEVAKELGVPAKRAREIERIMDRIIDKRPSRRRKSSKGRRSSRAPADAGA